ncbi:hypothetical protein HYE43_02305 [Mycoplasmopsis bovis]|nr:hypothetical protein [Mycoplasmopsis bovis]QQH20212.1 hypothetical protein HYE43_02305 [Mycoplasmopsis bovis]
MQYHYAKAMMLNIIWQSDYRPRFKKSQNLTQVNEGLKIIYNLTDLISLYKKLKANLQNGGFKDS